MRMLTQDQVQGSFQLRSTPDARFSYSFMYLDVKHITTAVWTYVETCLKEHLKIHAGLCFFPRRPKRPCPLVVPTMTATFLDENLPDGTRLRPGTKFIKYWKMRNTGTISWSADTKVRVHPPLRVLSTFHWNTPICQLDIRTCCICKVYIMQMLASNAGPKAGPSGPKKCPGNFWKPWITFD